MDNEKIREIFEAYFEKYKKTEGDRTIWSAYWTVYTTGHSFEINMTKQDLDIRFRVFSDGTRIDEFYGWDKLFASFDDLERKYGPVFERDNFFSQMADML